MTTTIINKCDILIPQGADWSFNFPVDPSIDLSNFGAIMMIRTRCGATFIAKLATSTGELTVNDSLKIITARISNEKSADFIPDADYVYDIKGKDFNTGGVYRTNEGAALVDSAVTIGVPESTGGTPVTGNGQILTGNGQIVTGN